MRGDHIVEPGRRHRCRAATCVPCAAALNAVDLAGGHVLTTLDAPFVHGGHLLVYEAHGQVGVAGVPARGGCVLLPGTAIGTLDRKPGVLQGAPARPSGFHLVIPAQAGIQGGGLGAWGS